MTSLSICMKHEMTLLSICMKHKMTFLFAENDINLLPFCRKLGMVAICKKCDVIMLSTCRKCDLKMGSICGK